MSSVSIAPKEEFENGLTHLLMDLLRHFGTQWFCIIIIIILLKSWKNKLEILSKNIAFSVEKHKEEKRATKLHTFMHLVSQKKRNMEQKERNFFVLRKNKWKRMKREREREEKEGTRIVYESCLADKNGSGYFTKAANKCLHWDGRCLICLVYLAIA